MVVHPVLESGLVDASGRSTTSTRYWTASTSGTCSFAGPLRLVQARRILTADPFLCILTQVTWSQRRSPRSRRLPSCRSCWLRPYRCCAFSRGPANTRQHRISARFVLPPALCPPISLSLRRQSSASSSCSPEPTGIVSYTR